MPQFDWEPNVGDVGTLVRSRTKNLNGLEIGTFTDATRPTGDQVEEIIEAVCADIDAEVGTVPERLWVTARRVAAVGAAAMVEISHFPEQVNSGRSPYSQLKEWYDEKVVRLVKSAEVIAGGEAPGDEAPGAIYGFDVPCPPLGMRTQW